MMRGISSWWWNGWGRGEYLKWDGVGLTICLVVVKTRGRQKWGENSFSLVWLGEEIKEKICGFGYFPPEPTKLQSL